MKILFCTPDVVVDSFYLLKNAMHLESPFKNCRLLYWEQWQALFGDEDRPWVSPVYCCMYWNHPPTLELPEKAESLHMSHGLYDQLADLLKLMSDSSSPADADFALLDLIDVLCVYLSPSFPHIDDAVDAIIKAWKVKQDA